MAEVNFVHTDSRPPLARDTGYADTYTPSLLHSITRSEPRDQAGLKVAEVRGEDLWTGYEFSWINAQGKPKVAGLRLRVSCQSPALVESKSMKLYLNSFSQTRFDTQADVLRTLDKDLSLAFRAPIMVELLDLNQLAGSVPQMPGVCLDDLDIHMTRYERNPDHLRVEQPDRAVHEALHTHLFRSLCPVTGQPDWASIAIEYSGVPVDRAGLLKYLISYRTHAGFHETTIEQIFAEFRERCRPNELTVYGRFQRRGGLDINPFRSTRDNSAPLYRMPRQ